jgi:hypothetical protein
MDDGSDKKSARKQIQSIYPGLRAGDFLQYLIISVVFLSLGYLMAYFFGTKMLLATTAQIMGAEATRFTASIIEETFIQLACGLPCAIFSIAPVVAVLLLLISRSPDSYQAILKLTTAILSFLFGLVIFVPVQMFLILGTVI